MRLSKSRKKKQPKRVLALPDLEQLGTREFVMYDPRDEHVMRSHAMDLLELTPEQLDLERKRGHDAVDDAPHPHRKYFWFD